MYSSDGLIFTSRKKRDYCAARIQSLYTNPNDHSLEGRVRGQAVSRLFSRCEICLDKVALGPGFPPNASFYFSCQYHSTNASY